MSGATESWRRCWRQLFSADAITAITSTILLRNASPCNRRKCMDSTGVRTASSRRRCSARHFAMCRTRSAPSGTSREKCLQPARRRESSCFRVGNSGPILPNKVSFHCRSLATRQDAVCRDRIVARHSLAFLAHCHLFCGGSHRLRYRLAASLRQERDNLLRLRPKAQLRHCEPE